MKKRRIVIRALAVAAVLVAAAVVFLAVMDQLFYRRFAARSAEVRASAGKHDALVTEQEIQALPGPLARYLRHSGVIGRKRISSVRLWHSGQFKPGADQPWMPITGEYAITTRKPSFSWYGKVRMAPGVSVVAFDSYFDGEGRMLVKAMSAFTIADDQSHEVDVSAFGRCIAELALAPTFFLDKTFVSCSESGRDQLKCHVADGHFATDADLLVNPDGSLAKIVVQRYYDRKGGLATLERFTGLAAKPKDFAGLRLPSQFDGTWNLPEGDLHYVSFRIDRVEYE